MDDGIIILIIFCVIAFIVVGIASWLDNKERIDKIKDKINK